MTVSPLTALVWIFAISAGILVALTICTLILAYRHKHRRQSGIYAGILAANPSSGISHVLTVWDLLMSPQLDRQFRQKLAGESQSQPIDDGRESTGKGGLATSSE
jgi:hypothetical protein